MTKKNPRHLANFPIKTYLCVRFCVNPPLTSLFQANTAAKSRWKMDPLIEFVLPIKGLHNGLHHYDWEIGPSFFEQFEQSPVQRAKVAMQLELDKRPSIYELNFTFNGTVEAECDRCLAPIQLPVEGEEKLVVKLGEDDDQDDDPDVIFIHPETQQLSVAHFIYEFIVLNLPMIKVYDCESETSKPCDTEMLKRLNQAEEQNPQDNQGSVWDELKKLNN